MTPRLTSLSWSWLLRRAILPAGELIFRQGMLKRLRFLEEAQWWDAGRVHEYRDGLLRRVIGVSYAEVPFYRSLMDEAGVGPADIRGPEDLRRLPVVTKAMLRSGYPRLTTRRTGRKAYEVSSSGSTGANFFMMEDAETTGWYRASFLLSLGWAGWRIGERHMLTGINLERSLDRRLKDRLLRCHYVSAYDLTDRNLDSALETMERHGIRHLWGYPGSLYYLALRARERGWNQPLTSIVTWGDNLYAHYRKAIEQSFGSRVLDTYGCCEGIQIAAQCGHASNYHVHNLDVVVEYLDDEGNPVPRGETGNLILTRLHAGPMPLIRYKVGDLGIQGAPEPCPCGRGFDLLDSIQGRDTDVVVTPSGNRLIVHFFTGILAHFHQIAFFQVEQSEPESALLRLVPSEGARITRDFANEVVHTLQDHGMRDIRVDVEEVDDIPVAPSGKRRFIVSKLGRPAAKPIP